MWAAFVKPSLLRVFTHYIFNFLLLCIPNFEESVISWTIRLKLAKVGFTFSRDKHFLLLIIFVYIYIFMYFIISIFQKYSSRSHYNFWLLNKSFLSYLRNWRTFYQDYFSSSAVPNTSFFPKFRWFFGEKYHSLVL